MCPSPTEVSPRRAEGGSRAAQPASGASAPLRRASTTRASPSRWASGAHPRAPASPKPSQYKSPRFRVDIPYCISFAKASVYTRMPVSAATMLNFLLIPCDKTCSLKTKESCKERWKAAPDHHINRQGHQLLRCERPAGAQVQRCGRGHRFRQPVLRLPSGRRPGGHREQARLRGWNARRQPRGPL